LNSEIERLMKQRDEAAARATTLEERRKHHALRGETWEAGKAKLECGRAQRLWTALDEQIRQHTTVDQGSTYRGNTFYGSNF
jgi:hypothetical protein